MFQKSYCITYIQRKPKIERIHASSMFVAELFVLAKTWKQLKCPSTQEWIKNWYAYPVEYYSGIKKE